MSDDLFTTGPDADDARLNSTMNDALREAAGISPEQVANVGNDEEAEAKQSTLGGGVKADIPTYRDPNAEFNEWLRAAASRILRPGVTTFKSSADRWRREL